MDQNRQQSEFNMAVSYLNRLNNLFYVADNASMALDMYTWYHALLVLFRELSTEMKKEELDTWEDKIIRFNAKISKHIGKAYMAGCDPTLYKELHAFELFLRKILKESGLQNRMADPMMALGV